MYSTLQRVQSFFGQLSTFGSILCLLIASTAILYPNTATSDIDVRLLNVIHGRQPSSGQERIQDYASLRFDLDADFTPLFNWNTKQVFVYLSATYPGPKYTHNEVIVWDKIIRSKNKAKLKMRDAIAKYKVNDITSRFGERNGTLTINWNVQPYVGMLRWGSDDRTSKPFEFPAAKHRRASA